MSAKQNKKQDRSERRSEQTGNAAVRPALDGVRSPESTKNAKFRPPEPKMTDLITEELVILD